MNISSFLSYDNFIENLKSSDGIIDNLILRYLILTINNKEYVFNISDEDGEKNYYNFVMELSIKNGYEITADILDNQKTTNRVVFDVKDNNNISNYYKFIIIFFSLDKNLLTENSKSYFIDTFLILAAFVDSSIISRFIKFFEIDLSSVNLNPPPISDTNKIFFEISDFIFKTENENFDEFSDQRKNVLEFGKILSQTIKRTNKKITYKNEELVFKSLIENEFTLNDNFLNSFNEYYEKHYYDYAYEENFETTDNNEKAKGHVFNFYSRNHLCINNILRGDFDKDCYPTFPIFLVLVYFFKKQKKMYEGYTFRNEDYYYKYYGSLKTGITLNLKGFISTSTSFPQFRHNNVNNLFSVFINPIGVDIKEYSEFQHENEILIIGGQFKILFYNKYKDNESILLKNLD